MIDTELFRAAVAEVSTPLGWHTECIEQDAQCAVVAPLAGDEPFEQVLWVLDTERDTMRCLVIVRAEIPVAQLPGVLEMCARINDGLSFGCAEFSFADARVLFRDAADLRAGTLAQQVADATSRVFQLALRYAPAVGDLLAGAAPAEAVHAAEAARPD